MVTAIPVAKISAQKIVLYTHLEGIRRGGATSAKSKANLEDNSTKGKISASAKKRIIAAVNWLYALSPVQTHVLPENGRVVKFRINLITLTLPSDQVHSDEEIKAKCLDKFLQILRKKYGLKSYIWKAEPQESGRLHFHITTNLWLHHAVVREVWNHCVNTLGYVDAYTAASGKTDPPSTEIRAVRRVKKLASYIAKYLTKESTVRKVTGRQWYLSQNLSGIEAYSLIDSQDIQCEIGNLVNDQKASWKSGEYATIIYADIFSHTLSKQPALREVRDFLLSKYQPLVSSCN